MSSIFKISEDLFRIESLVEDGVYTLEQAMDTIDALEWDLEVKADNYVSYIKNLTGQIETIKKEQDRLAKLRKSKENLIDSLKSNLQYALTVTNRHKLETDLYKIRIQKNPASLQINEDLVSDEYVILEPKVDKAKIKEDLKNGIEVSGASLVQTESLRIS